MEQGTGYCVHGDERPRCVKLGEISVQYEEKPDSIEEICSTWQVVRYAEGRRVGTYETTGKRKLKTTR
jgi:hypothetical protein